METNQTAPRQRVPWNKGKLVGQKAPFKPKDVWAMRARMEREHRTRELALFNLGIDSKLRGCDLVALNVRDIQHGAQIAPRAIITQHKTRRPVQFEITPPTRAAVQAWVVEAGLRSDDYLFPSRIHRSPHICTRQYARMLRGWVRDVGLDRTAYGTHSMRRTKAALIYQKTKNLRAVQLLLGHSKTASSKAQSAIWALTCMTRSRSPSRRRSEVERVGSVARLRRACHVGCQGAAVADSMPRFSTPSDAYSGPSSLSS